MIFYLFSTLVTISNFNRRTKEQSDIPITDLYNFSPVKHPNTRYKITDLDNAKKNVELYEWAKARNRSIISSAQSSLRLLKNESFIIDFISRTTPSTTTFCPNCYATGKNWHANGDWKWSSSNPNEIICNVCGMKFPNEQYPETLKIRSTWDPEQEFSYVDNGPVQCMNYKKCRSSIEGVIRGKKFNHMINNMNSLALGYFVSGNSEFAEYVKKAFLRLSEVLPKYLVYAGYSYSEYCDCDPHEAAKDPSKVKKFIFAPGNEQKTGLYNKYWAASRFGTSGMDGQIVKTLAEVYDLTADAVNEKGEPVYSDSEKELICKNCLVESALLGFYDTSINNKAVYNRQGVLSIGLATGSSLLTRFGIDGLIRTFNEWFLPDGGTPESVSYDIMTLGGIYTYGYSLRDYSDPDDFVPPEGEVKYSHFNANRDTIFDEAWQNLLWSSNGDFSYPPIADTYATTYLSTSYLDYLLMAFDTDTVRSYVKERMVGVSPSNEAFFYRDPNIDLSNYGPFNFPDIVFPYLSQGFLRTGELGRKSTIVLDASNYGGHHHIDSLNIVYKKDGRELLNDLGYLWDHANHSLTTTTNIHNTVFVDHLNQITTNRNGSFHLFNVHDKVKVMQASSNAYKVSNIYNRTIVQIEHKSGKSYLVDIFRASGGKAREYVFHGVHHNYTMNQDLKFTKSYDMGTITGVVRMVLSNKGYFEISNVLLRKKFKDGSYGENLIKPIPESFNNVKCPEEGTWCNYRGNGYFTWEVTNSAPNDERAVHFEATTPSDTGVYNVALNLGNCNGYTCPPEKGLNLELSTEYELEFLMKGTTSPTIDFQYWTKGDELNTGARKYSKSSDFNGFSLTEEWKKYSGKIHVGNMINALGSELNEELIITWNIDENYTFSSFIPKRNQMIFYEDGFGQRDHKNSDFGVTVPNFYIFRDEINETSTFVNVFEGNYNDEEIVQHVEIIEFDNASIAIKIQTKEGNDFILSSFNGDIINAYSRSTDARLAVDIENDQDSMVMFDGSFFNLPKGKITSNVNNLHGKMSGYFNSKSESWYEITHDNLKLNDINKCYSIFVRGNDNIERAYPISKVEQNGNKFKIFTRVNSEGFRTHETDSWRLTSVADKDDFSHDEDIFTPDKNKSPTDIVDPSSINNDSSTDKNDSSSSKGLSSGAIAAIVIVVIFVVAATAVGGFFLHRKIKKDHEDIYKSTLLTV